LLLSGMARAEGPADTQEALASHFRTAPEAVPPQMQLVQVFVNGVDAGFHQIIVSSGTVSLRHRRWRRCGLPACPATRWS
jgi:hypothetical protein